MQQVSKGWIRNVRSIQIIIAAVLFSAPLWIPRSAYADDDHGYRHGPPPWAPAYGYRYKHHGDNEDEHEGEARYAVPPGIARGQCVRQNVNSQAMGGILGGVLGGILGSQVGHGRGKAAATIGGTLLGIVVGSSIGRSMDAADERCASEALEYSPDRRPVAWVNPNNDTRYQVTPVKTFNENGRYCREYITKAVIGGKTQDVYGTACRQPDGSWQLVNN